jgi:hypothetical protein
MANLTRQQLISNLIKIYNSDAGVREIMIPQIKAEIEREHEMLGFPDVAVPNLDFDFVRMPESQRTTEYYFQRLLQIYFANKQQKWLRDLYKTNKAETA